MPINTLSYGWQKCVHCHEDIQIDADRDRLVQVMSNLLSNAAKYSPADMPVEIFTEINDDILRVNIEDYGPGIPKYFQSKLFEKFTLSNSGDTREAGGTGLGLSISKMIIEKLGGNVGFKTIERKETTFYFELPIVKTNSPRRPPRNVGQKQDCTTGNTGSQGKDFCF